VAEGLGEAVGLGAGVAVGEGEGVGVGDVAALRVMGVPLKTNFGVTGGAPLKVKPI
jgi:hypothetical protein